MKCEGLFQCQHKIIGDEPVIFLSYRTNNGKKIVEQIRDFKPYFYVDKKLFNDNQISNKIEQVEDEPLKTIFGDKVVKCYTKNPKEIYYTRAWYKQGDGQDCWKKVYESDIMFDLRYMIDKIDRVEETNLKVLTFDIETDVSQGFPKKDNPVEPITCVSLHDSYSQQIQTFVWREDLTVKKKAVDDGIVCYYNDEIEMLKDFIRAWRRIDPDILTAWNIGFDIGYLLARMRYLKIGWHVLSNVDVPEPVFQHPKKEPEILGTVVFDMLQAYKKMHFGELQSYTLNDIAHKELGVGKEKIMDFGNLWKDNLQHLIDYNRKDVDLVVRIDKKAKLIKIFDDIKRYAGVRNINDCFYASRIHETRIMKKYKDKYIFPSKAPFVEKSAATMIKGAFVKEPEPGLYENVVVLDFKSLYPSIIYTFNLSTEMKSENGVDINGVKLRQDVKGIMPSMIKELVELKNDMKKKVAGTGQNLSDKMFAIKTFINSFYGINALPSFRLYDKAIAENITFLGREVVTKCSSFVESLGYKVVYNDTDSLFVQVKSDIIKEGEHILSKINKFLKTILTKYGVEKSTMKIEFEKAFSKIILQTKKRYAGLIIWEDKPVEKLKVAGMAARRSDTPRISKKMQKDFLNIILKGGTKKQAINYIKSVIDDIISGDTNNVDIALPSKLNADISEYKVANSPKIRGVKYSNQFLETKFKAGSKFLLIYVKNNQHTNVVCFNYEEQLKGLNIDKYTMINKAVFQKIKVLFESLGWRVDYDQLVKSIDNKIKGQTNLLEKWI